MRTRAQYDQAFAIVREVVAKLDPYGLLGGGAPADEFDGEVARLLPLLARAHSETDASAAVAEVFGAAFGKDGVDVKVWDSVGSELFERLTSTGLIGDASNASA